MSTESRSTSFWTTLPGILTAIAGVITAVTGLLVALNQSGLIGGNGDQGGATPSVASSLGSPPSESTGGEGDALAGDWSGTARRRGSRYEVRLQVESPCYLKAPCGSVSISSPVCTSRATLWNLRPPDTYEFRLDQFSADSSPVCSPGAGEYFQLLEDGSLRYTTSYDEAVGKLEPVD